MSLKLSVAAVWVLCVWTAGRTAGCGEHQYNNGEQCCDLCRPGEYLKTLCSGDQQTVCHPCEEGYFSANFSPFDRCQKCQTCQEYAADCTRTTDAKCLCRSGFLCSDNLCSTCEEKKCAAWEKIERTDVSSGDRTTFSYRCEPKCQNNTYFDKNDCKPLTKCSDIGLVEIFKGNETHDSVCEKQNVSAKNQGDSGLNVILGMGFVLVSLALLVFLCFACIKSLRKHRCNTNLMKVETNARALNLSKEESAPKFISQYESKDSSSLDQLHVGEFFI
ncbi:tumor necrosis factor receptor superfamily member 18 [Betta splendens]|uniref:Tumor necrosis factor receptor superfamily member 18 n=1 Tax=Betta splendens TaxID=158456 RepID=A0A6P7MIU6_BETSP|nr:tumor necrosis factor receptor superfamily member 18 [Betta splendens]